MPSIGPASSRVGTNNTGNLFTRAGQRVQQTAAAAAWRGQRTGSITYDSQSGPMDTSPARNAAGLTADEVRQVLGFSSLYKAEPVLDQFGQPVPGQLQAGQSDLLKILGGDSYQIGGRTGQGATATNTTGTRLLQGLSVKQAIAFLYTLDEDELTQFQVQMFKAGYFKGLDHFSWGILDDSTKKAFQGMLGDFANDPDMTVAEKIDRATKGFQSELSENLKAKTGEGGAGGQKEILLQPEITDAQTLSDMIDQVSQDLFGKDIGPDRKAGLISDLQQKQKDEFMATTYRQKQIDIKNGRPAGEGDGEVDAFMNAIMGQESNGNPEAVNPYSGAYGLFQFMPDTWLSAARQAGLDPNDRSAANQKAVARHEMMKYYNEFGNWRDVAIAWYGGEGAVGASWANAPQDNDHPSLNQYADQAMAKFNAAKGGTGTGGYQDPTLAVEFRDKLDLTSEAKSILRAANPAEYEASKFANRAKEFFSLLAGV